MLRLEAPLVLFLVAAHALGQSGPEVVLGNSTLTGTSYPLLQQEFFGGIPFAEPPIGDLRFTPPVPKLTLNTTLFDASQWGAPCSQFFGNVPTDTHTGLPGVSEDCLSLNIFRPAGLAANASLPVMAWVYGGGFYSGAASQYNGSGIVAHSLARGTPIIYVALNYRLGPLGFPQGTEAHTRGAENLGLKDIKVALAWLQRNIAAFGGDKDKVTIFGESAGSILIAQLFLDPNFGDLVRAGILESGSAASAFLYDAARREVDWQLLVAAVPECSGVGAKSTFDCLRLASLNTIINATNTVFLEANEEFPFMPTIDGPGGIIPDIPSRLFARKHFAHLPFIAGTCLDEGPVFVPTTFNSTEQLRQWLKTNTTPSAVSLTDHVKVVESIIELYPDEPALGSPFGTGNDTFGFSSQFKRASAVYGDLPFTSVRREWSQVASNASVKVFGYLFTDPQPFNPPFLGVQHGCEIPYVFGGTPNGPAATILSQNVMDYWISFANSLDPNDSFGNTSRPAWTQYEPNSQGVINLNGADLGMIPDTFRQEQIQFLIDNGIALRH